MTKVRFQAPLVRRTKQYSPFLGEGYRPENEHEVPTDCSGAGQGGGVRRWGWNEPKKGGNVVIVRFLVQREKNY
jgi:hypothetical protein